MTGTVRRFAEVAEQVRAASGKLEKTRLVAELLRELPDDDLRAAVLFFSGSPFPRSSGRTMQVGFAALQSAALAVSGRTAEELHAAYLRWSDVGDALRELFGERRPPYDHSLAEIAARFHEIAETPAGGPTTLALTQLFMELGAEEARYAAKILVGELRIGLREGLVEDAVAAAFGVKGAEIRKAHQLCGDLGEVAVGARHGRLSLLQVAPFTPLKPMLATPEASAEGIAQRLGETVWVEDKLDGIRAQAHVGGGRVALYSRDLKEVSAQFPEVIAALERLPGELILDGELLAQRDGRALPFFELQKRLGRKELTEAILASVPVTFVAFDLLYQDGDPLLDHPFRERRVRLEGLPQLPHLRHSALRVRPAAELDLEFEAAKARANEGLMVKDPESVYAPGRRGMSWLKYKKPLEPLDVVVTGVEYGHGRRREVLSDYTFAVRDDETGQLVNIGKAYSGLTDAEILELTEYFKQNTLRSFGRFQLVKPELVIEVAFEAIQESPRHKSGFALRFPRIVRLRPDKTPADVNSLADVRRLYQQYRSVYAAAEPEGDPAAIS
ncbi:MAG: ATP-dependent DNA ligase [Armatimonadota bacterium]